MEKKKIELNKKISTAGVKEHNGKEFLKKRKN